MDATDQTSTFAEFLQTHLIDDPPESLTPSAVQPSSPISLRGLLAQCRRYGIDTRQPVSELIAQLSGHLVPQSISRAEQCRENAQQPRGTGKLADVDIEDAIARLKANGRSERDSISVLSQRYGVSRQAIHQKRKRQASVR